MGFDIQSLIPSSAPAGKTPVTQLRRGESVTGLEDLRGLLSAIRAAGERGLSNRRFKGLGLAERAEELRDTTLDSNRTLSQIRMEEDAGATDELFRVLMGDKVEPPREFISLIRSRCGIWMCNVRGNELGGRRYILAIAVG